jgi:ubiquinone/menaquinone biosynthesis C-methylase UbiE
MANSTAKVDTTAAEGYEQYMVPAFLGPFAERAVAISAPRPNEHVLDVACGTGKGARVAAAHVGASGRVVGVDLDAAMIEVARRLAQESPIPIEWHCASALQMPLEDATFDLCLCLHGLPFFPDRVAGLAEVRRVLKPTGRLTASVWHPLETSAAHHALVRSLERQGVDSTAAGKGFSFGEPDRIRETASAAGFRDVELRTEEGFGKFRSVQAFIDAIASGSMSARFSLAQLPDTGRAQFMADLNELLASYVTPTEFRWPMRTHIVLARP